MTRGRRPGERRPAAGADERHRRREQVFGDVLPDRTTDESGDDARDTPPDRDDWLRDQVPPHHG